VFLVELVAFLIVWPIMWWLGGRLAADGISREPTRRPPADLPDNLPSNVIDLEQFRRRHRPGRPISRR
jgi:hypothetical protein